MTDSSNLVSIVLVGCGAPLRSMGWYHAAQILDGQVPSARLTHIVEPFYLTTSNTNATGYSEFHAWKKKLESERGVTFYANVADVPSMEPGEPRLTIISARTSDNPQLFRSCVGKTSAIFLEKPGAPTVLELEAMRDSAGGVPVYMGFNKNVSSYVVRAREFVQSQPGQNCDITFVHNNNYATQDLPECFERNAEGMLKNMAIHELALLVTYYGVKADNISSVQADKDFSSCQTLVGPSSGKSFTDFDKLKFKVVTKDGSQAYVAADRCAGDDSVAIITDAASGKELTRFTMPDEATVANVPNLRAKHGEAMPYFFAQDPDYLKLKKLVVSHMLDGSVSLEGVATIDNAIETLKVAEHLTPMLVEQLK